MAPSLARTVDDWTGEDVTIAEIERELARLRDASSEGEAQLPQSSFDLGDDAQ